MRVATGRPDQGEHHGRAFHPTPAETAVAFTEAWTSHDTSAAEGSLAEEVVYEEPVNHVAGVRGYVEALERFACAVTLIHRGQLRRFRSRRVRVVRPPRARQFEVLLHRRSQAFETDVRGALESMLDELAETFGGQGKMFRQHRDVRFSADKSPYTTTTYGVLTGIPSTLTAGCRFRIASRSENTGAGRC